MYNPGFELQRSVIGQKYYGFEAENLNSFQEKLLIHSLIENYDS